MPASIPTTSSLEATRFRAITRDGIALRFTGREATSGLLDEVLDQIERWLSPG
jgi:hypothetical protein